jgi:hypothetical protein
MDFDARCGLAGCAGPRVGDAERRDAAGRRNRGPGRRPASRHRAPPSVARRRRNRVTGDSQECSMSQFTNRMDTETFQVAPRRAVPRRRAHRQRARATVPGHAIDDLPGDHTCRRTRRARAGGRHGNVAAGGRRHLAAGDTDTSTGPWGGGASARLTPAECAVVAVSPCRP